MNHEKLKEKLKEISTCGLHHEYTPTCRGCRDRYTSAESGYHLGYKDGKEENQKA